VSTNEFMRRRAVDVRLGGRYSLANRMDAKGNRREFACRTSRVSPFQMMIAAPVVGKVGERVISYFGEFGQLYGWVTDTVAGGFLLDLAVSKARREKLADTLTWLDRQQRNPDVRDARAQSRIVPHNPHSTLMFADGTTSGCFVIDMSVSGAAVSADTQPEVGTPLAVGAAVGRVVRHFREGFAVRFVKAQDEDRLEDLVIRS
jgi:PilZ domain